MGVEKMGYYDETSNGTVSKIAEKERRKRETKRELLLFYKEIKPRIVKAFIFLMIFIILWVLDRINSNYSLVFFAIVVASLCIYNFMYFWFKLLKNLK